MNGNSLNRLVCTHISAVYPSHLNFHFSGSPVGTIHLDSRPKAIRFDSYIISVLCLPALLDFNFERSTLFNTFGLPSDVKAIDFIRFDCIVTCYWLDFDQWFNKNDSLYSRTAALPEASSKAFNTNSSVALPAVKSILLPVSAIH